MVSTAVDVHNHVLPRKLLSRFKPTGNPYQTELVTVAGEERIRIRDRVFGLSSDKNDDPEVRLRDMDAMGIGLQVLSPVPTMFYHWADPEAASDLASEMNEEIARMSKASPRFSAIGQLPMQSIDASLRELRRFSELGLVGVELAASVGGQDIDGEEFEPLWEALNTARMGVFIHPHNPSTESRLSDYYLVNLIGNPLDTSICLARLLFSGVIERHPNIRFCFAHAGGFIPYTYGRLDHGHRVRRESATPSGQPPSAQLRNCYFDTIAHSDPALRYLIDSMGASRVVIGTDYPADMADLEAVKRLERLGLDAERHQQVSAGSARELFGLPAVK